MGDNDADIKLVQDNFLNQVIREPTRGDNILDLILTNGDDLVKETDVGGQLGNSDHCEIRFILEGENGLRSIMSIVYLTLKGKTMRN